MIRGLVLGAATIAFAAAVAFAQDEKDPWWDPNEGRVFPAQLDYRNANGTLRLLLDNGPMETKDHPFFTVSWIGRGPIEAALGSPLLQKISLIVPAVAEPRTT